MTRPDHRHIPFPLDAITGITADLARCVLVPIGTEGMRTPSDGRGGATEAVVGWF